MNDKSKILNVLFHNDFRFSNVIANPESFQDEAICWTFSLYLFNRLLRSAAKSLLWLAMKFIIIVYSFIIFLVCIPLFVFNTQKYIPVGKSHVLKIICCFPRCWTSFTNVIISTPVKSNILIVTGDLYGMLYFITEVDSRGLGEMVKFSCAIDSITIVLKSQSSCTSCWLSQPGHYQKLRLYHSDWLNNHKYFQHRNLIVNHCAVLRYFQLLPHLYCQELIKTSGKDFHHPTILHQ